MISGGVVFFISITIENSRKRDDSVDPKSLELHPLSKRSFFRGQMNPARNGPKLTSIRPPKMETTKKSRFFWNIVFFPPSPLKTAEKGRFCGSKVSGATSPFKKVVFRGQMKPAKWVTPSSTISGAASPLKMVDFVALFENLFLHYHN